MAGGRHPRARMLASREQHYRRSAARYGELLEADVEIQRRTLDEPAEARRAVASMERMRREID